MPVRSRLRRRAVATLAITGALALSAPADAAPRLNGLTVPAAAEGRLTRMSGNAPIACTATQPIPATFTSRTAGTLYAVISDGALLNLANTGAGRAAIRAGANTVDLANLRAVFNGPRAFYSGPLMFSRSLSGEVSGPVTVNWKVTLIATDRFGLPGAQASRTVRVTCNWV